MRSNSPLVANGYPLSGGNLIEIQKKKNKKNEVLARSRTDYEGQLPRLTFIIKYRYCIGGSDCARLVTG